MVGARHAAAACLAAAGVAACGGSGSGHGSVRVVARAPCQLKAIEADARFFNVSPAAVTQASSKGSNGMPQCSLTVSSGGHKVTATTNIELTPSAYFILERTIVEAAQIFSGQRLSPAPVSVLHLGLDASWFPQEQWLMTTDGRRVLTTSVVWSGARQGRKIALATGVSRPYLRMPHGKERERLSQGFASG
jgi:hypothetical protein